VWIENARRLREARIAEEQIRREAEDQKRAENLAKGLCGCGAQPTRSFEKEAVCDDCHYKICAAVIGEDAMDGYWEAVRERDEQKSKEGFLESPEA
ncbi:MAG TPA: hypothetical protein VE973_04255, partial [Candidatus Limnocylindria bacterium]|nr:hypothetical protein [Candidatus Limnocylindria bacterium]